jgi:uncharacterized protein (TIGR03085 family)
VTNPAAQTPVNALALSERTALADLMAEVGPDAPTLCGTWTTRDLAAHLIVRATRPDAAAGIVLSPLAGYTERVMTVVARRDWPEMVAEVRQGPPRWSPQSLAALDSATNTIEYFVHHEDVRRASEPWEPRELSADHVASLWAQASRASGYLLRRSPVGVTLAPTDGPAAGTQHEVRKGERGVVLSGPVGEIVLATYGRATRGLEISGADPDVAAFLGFAR